MEYERNFKSTDDLIDSMRDLMKNLDPVILSKFTGFFSVSAITVYELAIKDIIINYAENCHCDYGYFMRQYLLRINGKITIQALKDIIKKCGDEYALKFGSKLEETEDNILKKQKKSLCACYNNIIQCRNSYVHGGNINSTFQECIDNYKIGKNVIKCIYDTLN